MAWYDSITEDVAINFHLNGGGKIPQPNGKTLVVESGFHACLNDARFITGRNSNGKIEDRSKTGSWLGTVGYIILLDQIGSCFYDSTKSVQGRNTILTALANFTSLSQNEIDVIYALRNALAHDYALVNVNHKTPSLQHSFALSRNEPSFIKMPTSNWDGNFLNRTQTNQTTVDVEKFADLVESIYCNLKTIHAAGNLKIALKGGKNELITRYMFAYESGEHA